MLKHLWDLLFYSCRHKWKIIVSRNLVNGRGVCIGHMHTLQCEHCGKIKSVEL